VSSLGVGETPQIRRWDQESSVAPRASPGRFVQAVGAGEGKTGGREEGRLGGADEMGYVASVVGEEGVYVWRVTFSQPRYLACS
jgi:hypothetical protein